MNGSRFDFKKMARVLKQIATCSPQPHGRIIFAKWVPKATRNLLPATGEATELSGSNGHGALNGQRAFTELCS